MISPVFKQRLWEGAPLRGTFVKLNSPTAVEALAGCGLDFLVIDGEHAPCDQLTLENLLRAADCAGLPAVVRVPVCDDIQILKALDLGAAGVQLPGVETVEQARDIVRAARYAPQGRRGLSFAQRSARYGGMDRDEYLRSSNESVLTVLHIENRAMAREVETLCAIEGIDVLFIGPMDLSQSYGRPGNPSAPEVQAAVANIIGTANRLGKPVGIFAGSAGDAARYESMGARYVVIGSDAAFLRSGAREAIKR